MNRPANVVYIAGPMRGLDDCGRERFEKAERKLLAYGYRPINPGVLPTNLDDVNYMPICLAMISQADSIMMLDGWQYSEGANLEYKFAWMCRKNILLEGNLEPWKKQDGDRPLEVLRLSTRSMNALLRAGITTIGQLKQVMDTEPGTWHRHIRAMGNKMKLECEDAMQEAGKGTDDVQAE